MIQSQEHTSNCWIERRNVMREVLLFPITLGLKQLRRKVKHLTVHYKQLRVDPPIREQTHTIEEISQIVEIECLLTNYRQASPKCQHILAIWGISGIIDDTLGERIPCVGCWQGESVYDRTVFGD